jgi:lipase chaperone LimK
MSNNARMIWGGAAASAALALGLAMFYPSDKVVPKTSPEPELFSFVRSFEGTRPDGIVQAAGDDLVVSDELVRMFDYYLAATGEKSLQAIRAEIERDIDTRVKGRAAGQARQLLTRYLDYKQALVDVEQKGQSGQNGQGGQLAGAGVSALRNRLAAMQQTRMRFFSPQEADAMFGLEDIAALDAIARLEISQDQAITMDEKHKRIAALDAQLPQSLREAREEPLMVVRLEESIAKMRSNGASEDEIYRARAASLDANAASRFAELDREEVSWNRRIAEYRVQRNSILSAPLTMSDPDRMAALEQLRQTGFTADEQKRLAAYE